MDLIRVIMAVLILVSTTAACTDNELILYLAGHEDRLIDAPDLAFVLATHNFDARPDGNLVLVKTEKATYFLEPNGQKPGLANIVSIVQQPEKYLRAFYSLAFYSRI